MEIAGRKRIRLVDIAARAGVSRGTVSAVLNGTENGIRFSREKAAEIRKLARELDYIPNFSARVLNRLPSKTIGMQIDSEESVSHFVLLRAIERAAEAVGYRLLIAGAHHSPERQKLNYRTLRQHGVDAVICHSNVLHDELRDDGTVVVLSAEPVPGLSCVRQNFHAGFAAAIGHFRREGRRNIALVTTGHLQFDPVRARHRAFAELAPEAAGNLYTLDIGGIDPAGVRDRIGRMLDEFLIPRRIDAVLLQNDSWALGVIGLLAKRGLACPRDLSVVGYDNTYFTSCCTPSLSTIEANFEACGRELVTLALERIRAPEAPPRMVEVDTFFLPRESCLPLEDFPALQNFPK